jgi:chemotaxis protein methyltransferase CheR
MAPGAAELTDEEFERFRAWIRGLAGINLSEMKKTLVMTRLVARLRHYGLGSYGDYFALLMDGAQAAERQTAVDLLTTNETHFFREPRHFEFLAEQVLPRHPAGLPCRIWSAACSSGEEPYSIAMTLADRLGRAPWEVFASDLSMRALERARSGHYPLARAKSIPSRYLADYCLRGVGAQEGTFLVDSKIRARVQFAQVNLNAALPQVGEFDVVFIRNAMIYFDVETRRQVVARLLKQVRRGGYLLVGHAESLNDLSVAVEMLAPSIYRKRDE